MEVIWEVREKREKNNSKVSGLESKDVLLKMEAIKACFLCPQQQKGRQRI